MNKNATRPASTALAAVAGSATVPTVNELLQHGDVDFVQRAYRCILGRDADESGLATYVGMLRDGGDKAGLLVTLAQSSEASSRHIELDGLQALIEASQPRQPAPWVRLARRVVRPLQAPPHSLERGVRVLDNHLHRLHAMLDLQANELIALRAEVKSLHTALATMAPPAAAVATPPPDSVAGRQVPARAQVLLMHLRRAATLRYSTRLG